MRSPTEHVRPLSLALIGALALTSAATGCGDDDDTALEELEQDGVANQFVGERITVSGEVDRVFFDGSFLIDGEYLSLGVSEGTLVYGSDMPSVSEDDLVQVTGTVATFFVEDVERDFGFTYEDDPLILGYDQEFAVEADTVTVIPEGLAEDDPTQLEDAEEEGSAEAMVGQSVTVGGEVDSIISPEAFRIGADEPGEGTLVISGDALGVAEGGTVAVTGTVVEFVPADIEREFGFDVDDDLFVDFDDEFAVVADSVDFVPDD